MLGPALHWAGHGHVAVQGTHSDVDGGDTGLSDGLGEHDAAPCLSCFVLAHKQVTGPTATPFYVPLIAAPKGSAPPQAIPVTVCTALHEGRGPPQVS